MKNNFFKIFLVLFSFTLSSNAYAMTETFEDQWHSMVYATKVNSVAKIIKYNNTEDPEALVKSFLYELITNNKESEWKLDPQFVLDIKNAVKSAGSIDALIENKKGCIKVKNKTATDIEIAIYENEEDSEETTNIKFLRTIATGSANIVDVKSLGLPESLQGRVFSSCVHNFTWNDKNEPYPQNDILKSTYLQIKDPTINEYTSNFLSYTIQTLFYPEDYQFKTQGDIVFGILEKPVPPEVEPLQIPNIELKDILYRTFTVNGYGLGGVNGSNTLVNDDEIKRAGMQIVDYIDSTKKTFQSMQIGGTPSPYFLEENKKDITFFPEKFFSFCILKQELIGTLHSNFNLWFTQEAKKKEIPIGTIEAFLKKETKFNAERYEEVVSSFLTMMQEDIRKLNNLCSKHIPECRLPFKNILETGISVTYIKAPGIPIRSQSGHSGSGALLWNSNNKKYEIVGIVMSGTDHYGMQVVDLPRKNSPSIQEHLTKLEKIFKEKPSNQTSSNLNTYTFAWPYAERFTKTLQNLLKQGDIPSGVFKF